MAAVLRACTVVCLALAAQVQWLPFARVQQAGGSPLSRNEHPRLLVTTDTVDTIRTHLATGGIYHSEAAAWFTWLDANYATTWGANDRLWAAQAFAFASVITRAGTIAGLSPTYTESQYASKSKTLLLDHITAAGGQADAGDHLAALVYDWIWPHWSTAERATVASYFQSIDKVTFNQELANTFTVLRRAAYLLFGLALAGDGLADSWAHTKHTQTWSTYIRHPVTGLHTTYSAFGGPDGANPEGNSYGWYYNMFVHVLIEEAYRTATATTLSAQYSTSDTDLLRYQPKTMAYALLPVSVGGALHLEAWNYMRDAESVSGIADAACWLSQLASLYRDLDPTMARLASWLYTTQSGGLGTSTYQQVRYRVLCRFVMPNDRATAQSPDALGLSPSVITTEGKVVLRDEWLNDQQPVITIWLGKWAVTPYHSLSRAPGNFTIYRRGPMVIQRGGKSGHDWGGAMVPGSSNILLFTDRSRSTPASAYEDYGGPRLFPHPNNGSTWGLTNGSVFDTRDALAWRLADPSASRDADYVFADLTRAYNSTLRTDGINDAKISAYTRRWVVFRPATASDSVRMVVCDRAVTLDVKFEKHWIFNPSGDPTVSGHTDSYPGPVRGGTTLGKTTYVNATEVHATQTTSPFSGQVWLTPLVPTSRQIILVGGDNGSGQAWQSDSREYETPYGEIGSGQAGAPTATQAPYVGRYRVEVIPQTPATTDIFINAIEVAAIGAAKSPTARVSGTGFEGARMGDRVAVCATGSSLVTSGTVVLPASGTYRVLIEGLVPATSVQVTGGTHITSVTSLDPNDASSPFTTTTTSGDTARGTLYLAVTVGADGAGAENTLTLAPGSPPALSALLAAGAFLGDRLIAHQWRRQW